MPSPIYNALLGVILTHLDGSEYYISRSDSKSDILSLTHFESKVTVHMSHSDFFFFQTPFFSFYKNDEDDTLYPLSNFESIVGS